MKKIIYIILMILILLSCKKAGDNENKNSKDLLSSDSGVEAADLKFKVTFIELGSVRCIPCKMMQPVMKQVEEKYKDIVKVVFYDVWTEKDASRAQDYKIKVIPTQVFLDENGNEYFRHEGYFPFEELEKILKMKGVR